MINFHRKTSWLHLVILLVLVGAAAQSITWAGWLAKPENLYADLWHRLAGCRYAPSHVAIVTLDEPTLAEHPEEPLVCWTPHFARVIAVLRGVGARIMGLDYLYYVSIENWLKKLNLPPNHPGLTYDAAFQRSAGVRAGGHGGQPGDGRPAENQGHSAPPQLLRLPAPAGLGRGTGEFLPRPRWGDPPLYARFGR